MPQTSWASSDLGKEVTAGFRELDPQYRAGTATERKKALDQIGGILRGYDHRFIYDLKVARSNQHFSRTIMTAIDQNAPPRLAWLHRLYNPDARAYLALLVQKLIEI